MPLRKRSLEDEDEGSRKRLKPFQPAADIIELDSDQDQPSNMAATAPSASDGEALSVSFPAQPISLGLMCDRADNPTPSRRL